MRSVWSYLLRYRGRVALGAICLMATSGLAMGIPWLVKGAIDALGEPGATGELGRYALAIAALAVAQGLIRIASRIFLFDAARQAEYDLRNDLFRRLLSLSPSYFRRTSTGDLMARLTNDTQSLRGMWGPGVLNLVNTVLIYVAAIALMTRISPRLTLLALLPYPLLVIAARVFAKRLFRLSKEAQDQMGVVSATVQEDLAGIAVIKTYALEHERGKKFAQLSGKYLDINIELASARGQMMPVLGALGSVGTIVVLWQGGRMVVAGDLTLGAMIAFNVYLALLVWPTLALGWIVSMFQRGMASWARINRVLSEVPTIADGHGPAPATVRGEIELRALDFSHDGRAILKGVSIKVPAGSICAIVGRTGGGKTTVVEAIPRLLELPAGAVFLDGIDVTTLPLATLRDAIGYAPQEAFLFSATIAENIEFGRHPAPDETAEQRRAAVLRAAEAAGLARDLSAFPRGLDTIVGERGITLSGGQRQRVALARALAARPRILILDDSLSSVDAETEKEILRHLAEEMKGRTAIVISHRAAAVATADQIVVLDDGRVVDVGRHDELLARGGVYADLYRKQVAAEAAA